MTKYDPIQRFNACNNWKQLLLAAGICLLPALTRADLWVTGYYPGYATGRMAASNIDFTTVTHVIHFSIVPNNNGSLNTNENSLTTSACTNLVKLAHAAGRKALVCIGGADTESNFLAATTNATLGIFVTNIFNFMTNYSYDGVDIDWEPIASTDANQYTNLILALRTILGANRLLTVAAGAYPESGDSPTAEFKMLASVQRSVNQINMETYALSGPWEGWVTWYNSPIYDGGYTFPSDSHELVPSINGALSNFVNNGISPTNLGVGTCFYGQIWTGGPGVTQPRQSWPANNPPTITAFTYANIIASNYPAGFYHWDSVAQSAYFSVTNNTIATNSLFVAYDDTNSTAAKVSFARNHGLGGIMVWELTQDYISSQPSGQREPLLSSIKHVLATPNFAGVQESGTNFSFNFTTAPLGLYRVFWSTNLLLGPWNILTDNVAGTGTNVSIIDTAPEVPPGRFYRILTPP